MHKIDFFWGPAPDPTVAAYTALHRPIAEFKRPYF